MAVANDRNHGHVRLRPRRSLLWSGILIFIIVPIPIVATLVTLGLTSGSWPISVVAEGISLVLFVIGFYLFQTTYLVVSATHFTERGFFGRPVITPISEVSSTVIAHTTSTSTE